MGDGENGVRRGFAMLRILWRGLLDTFFPPTCLACKTLLKQQEAHGSRAFNSAWLLKITFFCESCQRGLTPVGSPCCLKCGLPFVSWEGEDHTCSDCLTQKKYFRLARAFGVYDGDLMEAVHLFKYGRKTALVKPLSALVRRTFFHWWDRDEVDLIVPVPLHVKRLRERGFNQAYLLIRKWAKEAGIPFDGLTLQRHRYTEPQTALSRAKRKRNMRGAFSLRDGGRVVGKRILLVDDVYTTGATVNECARVLTKAGAKSVDVLTLARAA